MEGGGSLQYPLKSGAPLTLGLQHWSLGRDLVCVAMQLLGGIGLGFKRLTFPLVMGRSC